MLLSHFCPVPLPRQAVGLEDRRGVDPRCNPSPPRPELSLAVPKGCHRLCSLPRGHSQGQHPKECPQQGQLGRVAALLQASSELLAEPCPHSSWEDRSHTRYPFQSQQFFRFASLSNILRKCT